MKIKSQPHYFGSMAHEMFEKYVSDADIEAERKCAQESWLQSDTLAACLALFAVLSLIPFSVMAAVVPASIVGNPADPYDPTNTRLLCIWALSAIVGGVLSLGLAYVRAKASTQGARAYALLPLANTPLCLEAKKLMANYSSAKKACREALLLGRELRVFDLYRMRDVAYKADETDANLAARAQAYQELRAEAETPEPA